MAPGLNADSQKDSDEEEIKKRLPQKELVRAPGVKSQTGKLVPFFSGGSAGFT